MTARTARREITSDGMLLVEGKDEENLLRALITAYAPENPSLAGIQIRGAGGKDGFPAELEAVRIAAIRHSEESDKPLHAIGILRDADHDAAAAFQSVERAVRRAGLKPPAQHGQFSDAAPSIGIFIVPDDASPGAIETICRSSVEATHAARCAEEYLTCLSQEGPTRSAARTDKAFAHAFLASGDNPVARVGEGAKAGVWDFSHPAFAALRSFIAELANQ